MRLTRYTFLNMRFFLLLNLYNTVNSLYFFEKTIARIGYCAYLCLVT